MKLELTLISALSLIPSPSFEMSSAYMLEIPDSPQKEFKVGDIALIRYRELPSYSSGKTSRGKGKSDKFFKEYLSVRNNMTYTKIMRR